MEARCCNCKDLCTTRRCICRRWGGACKQGCKCRGELCNNRFRDLNVDFGPQRPGLPALRASHCFTDYVEKSEKVDFRHSWNQNFPKTTVKSLESRLLADSAFFEMSDELREWREKFDTLAIDSEKREEHMQWLFRLGLSNEEGNKYLYSFYLKSWTDDDNHRHCAACNRCCSIKVSWHCSVCRQCRHEGLDVTCFRCGGRSLTATSRQGKE